MSIEYEEFKKLIARKQFRQAAVYAEDQYFHGKNIFWITQQAYAYIRAGKYDRALECTKEVLALDPGNIYALLSAADALRGLQQYDEALWYYKEVMNREKVHDRALKGICECFLQMKEWEKLLDFISTQPGQMDDYVFYRIKALKATGKTEKAIKLCRETLSRLPHDPATLWELTDLEIEQDGIDRVIEEIGRYARIPTFPAIYKEIYASICRKAGKTDLALKTYDKMDSGIQDVHIQRQKAFTLAKTHKEQEALPLFEELLKLNPKDIYVHSSYGAACARIGEIERGINFYHALLQLYPEEKGIYGYINRLKKKLGKS
ncbi:MAG: tetratricopeptide repeat protein [Spirochaetales bacterium]|nr:tetratricopeptide repeat protein [Spirochaetales bacterium]